MENHNDSKMFLVLFTHCLCDTKSLSKNVKELLCCCKESSFEEGSSGAPLIPNFKAIRCLHGKLVVG